MQYGAQLYTLRDFTKDAQGFRSALERVAKMGYQSVQVSAVEAFLKDVSPGELRSWLDELGLVCCATHRPFDRLKNNLDEEIEIHQTIGCPVIGIGMAPKEFYEGDAEDWREWTGIFNEVAASLHEVGLSFAFHNHAVEFERKCGTRSIDVLIEESHPSMQFIVDTYWVAHAGADVNQFIDRVSGRVNVAHLKDKEVKGWDTRECPIGDGNLDWPSILDSLTKAGCQHAVVEQDHCYGEDPFSCMEKSIRYLKSLPG
ncbi:MAG TPA: sugar phosphate isomerase/epimerase [Fimbriimonas sp.]|nr:sugar phosphate isomerase/epimerase [Fimbriimonas sp.]